MAEDFIAVASADQQQDEIVADLISKSERAFANYTKEMASIDRSLIGRWYGMPARMQADGWCFYRCGRRSSPQAIAIAYMLRQHGWVDAPSAVRCVGFESDAEEGLYLCCAPSVYGRMKEVESLARRKRSRKEIGNLDNLAHDLGALGSGVEIERMDVKVGQASIGDVEASTTDARLRSRVRNQRG